MAAPHVTILLCTFNGSRFLRQQLDSIARQDHKNWRIIVSDDGSADSSLEIVREFAAGSGATVEIRRGPQQGASVNFMSLVADEQLPGEYFAFCDQDDIWHRDRLSRAIANLETVPAAIPALYGGRTRLVSANGAALGYSRLFRRQPSFRNAMVQNILGGNTMLLNRAAKKLLESSHCRTPPFHDWWTYLLVSGAGGHVIYDPVPGVDYRQHDANVVSGMATWRSRLRHSRWVYGGGFAGMVASNLAALRADSHLLTEDSRGVLAGFEQIRSTRLATRLEGLRKVRPYRQHALSNLALLTAVMLRRV